VREAITKAARFVAGLGHREYVLAVLVVSFATQYLNRQVTIVMAQPIKVEFGLSDAQLGLLTGFVFSIPYSLMLIPVGALVDRVNRRNLLVIALSVWSFFTAITGFVQNLFQLSVLRATIAAAESSNNPNALSMLADLYDRRSRATVVGIFFGGPTLATVVGFPLVAYIGDKFGWRMAFVAAGLPGLFLAALTYFTVREPQRERVQSATDDHVPSVGEAFRFFCTQKSALHLIAAMTFTSTIASGTLAWMVPLMMRKHGMALSDAGLAISLYFGATTFVAHLFGGVIADWLAHRDVRWYAWFPAVAAASNGIVMVGGIMAPPLAFTLTTLALWGLMSGVQYGPVLGSLQSLVLPRMRGVASSTMTFMINLVGAGVGPLLVGFLSDRYLLTAGNHSLPYALATVSLLQILVLFHFLRASAFITEDLKRVDSLAS